MRTVGIEYAEKGKMRMADLGEPPPLGPTQVLFETRYSGLTNGTERHAFLIEHGYGGGAFPSRHGYQHVGEVVAVGEAVQTLAIGDWLYCGDYVGHRGWHVVDEHGLVVKLPDTIDRKYCALFGVAGVALRSVRRMAVSAGDNVWVVGQGPIGHFTAQAARAVGARVTVTDMIDKRLEAARACGAHVALNAGDENTMEALKQGAPYNYIYDGCSLESLLYDIFQNGLLAHGGTVGMMAVRDAVRYPWGLLHGIEARIETSCHFTPDDLRVLLFLYEREQIRIEPMVSHLVSIDEAPGVYDKLANHGEELLGVIFDWS
jgi:2-desacetyl-2-hydroxyethyl bacteriochlorophyllide A dehydrogenase